ncbi:MAG: hypothetical protein J5806_07190 [Lentisphaeria bacterium]|nr:hypothetical protein [Lentisphaeria bacterium]
MKYRRTDIAGMASAWRIRFSISAASFAKAVASHVGWRKRWGHSVSGEAALL